MSYRDWSLFALEQPLVIVFIAVFLNILKDNDEVAVLDNGLKLYNLMMFSLKDLIIPYSSSESLIQYFIISFSWFTIESYVNFISISSFCSLRNVLAKLFRLPGIRCKLSLKVMSLTFIL
jgi:hypothetical protein